MSRIELHTKIDAPIERCFDLSRSIDLHKLSTEHTDEKAIAGTVSGLIDLDDFVTWEARHFGFRQRLTTRITEFEKPYRFVDMMEVGAFKGFTHLHEFKTIGNHTIMIDVFDFISPLGFIGKLVDILILKRYMTNLLSGRNHMIKKFAETNDWKLVLSL